MVTREQIEAMKHTDIRTIDKNTLVDMQNFQFDNGLSMEERMEQVLEKAKNPYCFRYGDLGIKVEFTEGGPTLETLLTEFLIRKKSGL